MKGHRQKTYLLVAVPAVLMLVFGSTSLVAAEDGTPLSRSRYTPFGEAAETQVWREEPADSGTYAWVTLDPTEPITQTDTLYQGDTLERELGIYFTADGRYYDPWLGKYLQPDPIGGPPLIPQAADRYQYAGNSPTGVGYANTLYQPSVISAIVDETANKLAGYFGGELSKRTLGSLACFPHISNRIESEIDPLDGCF